MEDKYKEKKENYNRQQKFYFNDEGELVVETNKGVIVDGENFVKAYGDFTCNARTLGEIVRRLKGINVEIGVEEKLVIVNQTVKDAWGLDDTHTIQHYCVLGASEERVREYEKELAKSKYSSANEKRLESRLNNMSVQNESIKKEIDELRHLIDKKKIAIEDFNRLPWWKRIFKKIEIK